MIEIDVKYKVGDHVTLVSGGEKMRVVGYEYIEGRGIRYIMTEGHEYKYHYDTEIKLYTEGTKLGFSIDSIKE